MDPDYADAYLGRGFAYYYLDKYEKALENCEYALELSAKHPDAIAFRKQLLEEHPDLKP